MAVHDKKHGLDSTDDHDVSGITDGQLIQRSGAAVASSGVLATDAADAVAKKHEQNKDQFLDQGGVSQVSAADAKDAVDKKHEQNKDTFLDQGGANEVTAADAKDAVVKKHEQNKDTKLAEGTGDEVTATALRELVDKTDFTDAGNADKLFFRWDGAKFVPIKLLASHVNRDAAWADVDLAPDALAATEVQAAIMELTKSRGFMVTCGRDHPSGGDQFMRGADGVAQTLAPIFFPFKVRLISIVATARVASTATVEVHDYPAAVGNDLRLGVAPAAPVLPADHVLEMGGDLNVNKVPPNAVIFNNREIGVYVRGVIERPHVQLWFRREQ